MTLVTGRLIGGGRVMGGRLIGVRLYHIFDLRKYELDRKKIIAVIYTTFAVKKRKPEKIRLSGFLFTTAKILSITAMIFFYLIHVTQFTFCTSTILSWTIAM